MFYLILVLHVNEQLLLCLIVTGKCVHPLKVLCAYILPFLYYYDEVQVVITSFVLTDLITAVLFLKFIKIASLHNQVSQMKLKLKKKL